MPYKWIDTHKPDAEELHLWPHQSLPPRGYAAFILATFTLVMIPLFPLLGTVLMWGILPFLLLAVGGIWFALERSHRNAQVLEVLTLTDDRAHLVRHNPRGDTQEWDCNIYWTKVDLHRVGGPVPNYVTLKGSGREVEIGAFLSEPERKALYGDLSDGLRRMTKR